VIDGNRSGLPQGQSHHSHHRAPGAQRESRVSRGIALAVPCVIALLLGVSGVLGTGTPSRGGPSTSARRAPAGVLEPAAPAAVPGILPESEAFLVSDRAPAALEASVDRPQLDGTAGSATLDPKTKVKLDKLVVKMAKEQAKVEALQVAETALETSLVAAEQALADAQALPAITAAELKAKLKAVKKAGAALLKLQKKSSKMQAGIAASELKVSAYVASVEELDPGHFDQDGASDGDDGPGDDGTGGGDTGGDGGDTGGDTGDDDGPPPDGSGNGDDGSSIPSGGTVSVPLYLQEVLPQGAVGFARNGVVTTFGLPFPNSDHVGLVNGRPALSVVNSGIWQTRTLATWPDGSVKWALMDVAANVPAGAVDTSLRIANGEGRSGPDDLAHDDGSLITIDTGDLVVQVSKTDFDVFHRAWLGATELVHEGASTGIVGTLLDGTLIVPKPGTVTVAIEENGPARCVVRADGMLHSLTGLDLCDFTCRITARAGSHDVQVDFTVRNANITMPHNIVLDGLGISIRVAPGAGATGTVSKHNGPLSQPLAPSDWMFLHQGQSSAYAYGTVDEMTGQLGYQVVRNGSVLYPLGDKTKYPLHGYADLSGAAGGMTVAYKDMPFEAPASLELYGTGDVLAGLFSTRHEPGHFWSFGWRQHESRTACFSFHAPGQGDPAAVAAALDIPVAGRAADYLQYDRAGVFPYRLVSLAQENQAFAKMGLNYSVASHNEIQMVTRWLYAHESGGSNNFDSIEKRLGGDWLRQGIGGAYLTGLDLALYKSEWQIVRSDNFLDKNAPVAVNPELPHETGYEGEYEHRYRDGIALAYWLTGDARFRDALYDEAEILNHLYFYEQERGMAQCLRAIAVVGQFTGDPGGLLKAELKSWLQTWCTKLVDINVANLYGWGWEAMPDQGARRFFVTNKGANTPPPAGNNYWSRGFFTASLHPLAMYHAARWLGLADPQGALARGRMRDLAFFGREELYPYKALAKDRWLTYVYGANMKTSYQDEESDAHPLLLGFGQAFKDTGDLKYLQRGIEELQGFAAHDNGQYANNLYGIENRLDVQDFFRVYLDWLAATGQ